MTPDDKRRLAALRARYRGLQGDMPPFGDVITLLRLLDEALEGEDSLTRGFEAVERECRGIRQRLHGTEAQRDAVMAALRAAQAYRDAETDGTPRMWRGKALQDLANELDDALAAHSAATKPADPVEKVQE